MNFVANVLWQKVFSPKNTARHFSEDHDHVLVYARSSDAWTPNEMPRSDKLNASYKNTDAGAALVVHGEAVRVGPQRLAAAGVTFRQIPYELSAR